MNEVSPSRNSTADAIRCETMANWSVRLVQLLFVIVALFELDAPFLSAHNERQNQSFDMARHVYRDGWSSVLTPKVSFVFDGYENLRYSAVLLEFPFQGLLAWPLVQVTTHERAVSRLIAVAFSLAAIQILYGIMRFWLPPIPSALGTAIWALAPLILQFGQLPMPDILCTTGIMASFWFALRGKMAGSSACFLFAILAKVNVIVYGLPILVALLISRQCGSWRNLVRISLAWGLWPLLGIILWMTLLNLNAPPTKMSMAQVMGVQRGLDVLVSPAFYRYLLGCLFPFGVGVLGFVGGVFAFNRLAPKMDARVKWAIVISNAVFLGYVFRKVSEPQYILPVLPWLAIAAAFGFAVLLGKLRAGFWWRATAIVVALLHVGMATAFTVDLKSSRVPDYEDVQRAAKLLPPGARVITLYRHYGASPAVWLERNVLAIGEMKSLEICPRLRREGFEYLMILDIDASRDPNGNDGPLAWIAPLFHALRKTPPKSNVNLATYANPAGPYRQYCDSHFKILFESPHVVLYLIPAELGSGTTQEDKTKDVK